MTDFAAEIAKIEAEFVAKIGALRVKAEAAQGPKDPGNRAETVVITFTKNYGNPHGRTYSFAAIQPAGLSAWSVTGKGGLTSVPWKRVADFMREDEGSTTEKTFRSITVLEPVITDGGAGCGPVGHPRGGMYSDTDYGSDPVLTESFDGYPG